MMVLGLFGISGVGKSYLSAKLVRQFPDLLHLQASQLLRTAHASSGETLRTANADTIAQNQIALGDAFNSARKGQEHKSVILDAHSVIDNDKGLVAIHVDAIRPLSLTHILFVSATPEVIIQRRAGDDRARPVRSLQQIAEYQEKALLVSLQYSRDLEVPFLQSTTDEEEKISNFVREALEGF
jgi:adenylate kinase